MAGALQRMGFTAQRDGNVGYYLLFNLTVLGYTTDISWLYGEKQPSYDSVAIRTF